jgi:phosphonatase-like hydrolase
VANFPSLVIFDLAGTTVEDRGQVPAAFAEAFAEAGMPLSADQIRRVRGASKRHAIRRLLPPYQESRSDEIYQSFRHKLAHRYTTGGVRSIADAGDIFRRLKEGDAKVALTTGFDRDTTMLLLSSLGWTGTTVDAVVCGDDVTDGRPAPDMILLAMKLTGVSDTSQVANVGDTALDLEAASRAGVKWNIGVLSGAHTREVLEQAPHTDIIDSIADLRFGVPSSP